MTLSYNFLDRGRTATAKQDKDRGRHFDGDTQVRTNTKAHVASSCFTTRYTIFILILIGILNVYSNINKAIFTRTKSTTIIFVINYSFSAHLSHF